MMRIKTASGGTYLLDTEKKLVRMETRGPKNTSQRLNGQWQEYAHAYETPFGLFIDWGPGQDEHTKDPAATGRATLTSRIVEREYNVVPEN